MVASVPVSATWRHSGPDHPSLVPASLLALPDDDTFGRGWHRVRRTGRDWTIDAIAFVMSVGFGGLFLSGTVHTAAEPLSRPVVVVDVVSGAIACLAIWLRRRWPVGVALATLPVVALSAFGAVATLVTLFTVAVHRRVAVLLPVTFLFLAAAFVYTLYRPDKVINFWEMNAYSVIFVSAILAWGMFVRARRQLVLSLRERAERAEATQRLFADQARSAERARIAREMHDVLAHRITMVALHAGALEMRSDLPAEQVGATAGLIRSAARQALEELREVVGVLRTDGATDTGDALCAPQPTLADIGQLVTEARHAGMNVEASMDLATVDDAPGALGRDAYRIVQEALTNVSKHARGTATIVHLDGRPGDGLNVVVRNRLPVGELAGSPEAVLPGGGTGLTGLAERVSLSGGTLVCGPTAAGDFVVAAQLRWPA